MTTNDMEQQQTSQMQTSRKRWWQQPFVQGAAGGLLAAGAILSTQYMSSTQTHTPTTQNAITTPSVDTTVSNNSSQYIDEDSVMKAVQNVQNAIVSIQAFSTNTSNFYSRTQSTQLEPTSEGSGVLYKVADNKAYLVTNNHVISGSNEIKVLLTNGESVTGTLVGSDEITDLAVVSIDAAHVNQTVTFANSDNVKAGQTALAIGSPLGSEYASTVTRGIVSAVNRVLNVDTNNDNVEDWQMEVIQTDAAINPGNSGGALVDLNGNLIGINSMKITNTSVEGIGFAIPSNQVKTIIEQLEKNGSVNRPSLGVRMSDISDISNASKTQLLQLPSDVQTGVVFTYVQPNSIAERNQIKQYDVITKWNNTPISNIIDLRKQFYSLKSGDVANITILRQGKEINLTLSID